MKKMEEIINNINEMMTSDLSQEQIDKLNDISSSLEEFKTAHNKLKEDYIKAIKNEGSSENPGEMDGDNSPKTFEEYAEEFISKLK